MSKYTWEVVWRVSYKLPTSHRQYPPLNYALTLKFPTWQYCPIAKYPEDVLSTLGYINRNFL